MRLDQRNGRAHRIGQTRPAVRALYFLPAGDETRIVATISAKNRVRRSALRPAAIEPPPPSALHLRPRVARDAAILQLLRRGIDAAPFLRRRHKAGVERLIEEMAREYLDEARLRELEEVLEREREVGGA